MEEPDQTFIARQRLGKHVSAKTRKQATIVVLLRYNGENGVYIGSVTRLYNEDLKPAETELRKPLEVAVKDN
jgi:hypothetical protein